jgi:hypothetical protein
VEFRKERARRVHQRNHKLKGEASRLLNTLEERLCRGGHREKTKFTEDSVEALPGGHRASAKSAQEELYFEFRDKGSVQEEDTYRVVEYSASSTRSA